MTAPAVSVLLVWDRGGWFVRRVRVIEHDEERDEMVHRCDAPLAWPYTTIIAAAASAVESRRPKRRGKRR